MKKRMVSFLMCLVMAFSLIIMIPNEEVKASSPIESALSWAVATANDNSHGYSQSNRWGPDYDCSSFVITALKKAGISTGSATYTGNMKSELTKHGFTWIPWSQISSKANLKRGDILLNISSHTEFYLGDGKNVGAHSNRGYPASGDQTGTEVSVSGYYYHPWDGVLRYTGSASAILPGTQDTSYNVPVTLTASRRIHVYDACANDEYPSHYIDKGDSCYISEVYTNGYIKVRYPVSGGTRWSYAKASDFALTKKSTAPSGYTISINESELYDCEAVTVTITPYESGVTNYMLYWVKPNGTVSSMNLGNSNTTTFYPETTGTHKFYAKISNQSGSFTGAVNNGGIALTIKKPSMGSKENLGYDFYGYIINSASGNALTNDGTNVSSRTYTGSSKQKWHFKRNSDGSYTITSVSDSSQCLDAYSANGRKGDNVEVYPANTSGAQKWYIYDAGSGSYYFMPQCSNSAVIDIYNNSSESGANAWLWVYNQSAAQKFEVKKQCNVTVYLNANGGTVSAADVSLKNNLIYKNGSKFTETWAYDETHTYGLTNAKTLGLTRSGYTFKGWGTKSTGGTIFDQNDTTVTAGKLNSNVQYENCSITLYAIWEKNHVHSYVGLVTKQATCTEAGEEVYICSCGDKYTKTIKAKGHTVVTDKAVAVTCTEDGKTEGSHCSVCGTVIKKQETAAATGHSYDDWVIAIKATCHQMGLKIRTCANCDAYETQILNATKHVYGDWVTTTAPTYTTEGVQKRTCSLCGDRETKRLSALPSPATETPATETPTTETPTTEAPATETPKTVTPATKKRQTICYVPAPAKFKAAKTSKGIKLTWKKSTGAKKYVIYRKGKGGTWKKLATIKKAGKVSYVDKTAKKGKTYTYKIKAVNGNTYSKARISKKVKR